MKIFLGSQFRWKIYLFSLEDLTKISPRFCKEKILRQKLLKISWRSSLVFFISPFIYKIFVKYLWDLPRKINKFLIETEISWRSSLNFRKDFIIIFRKILPFWQPKILVGRKPHRRILLLYVAPLFSVKLLAKTNQMW